jgi:hypothetical protein
MSFMPPKERGIFAPVGGWIEHSYYVVELSVTRNNPVWQCLLYTGFLGTYGEPGGYSGFITHGGSDGDSAIDYDRVHYLKPLFHLTKQENFKITPVSPVHLEIDNKVVRVPVVPLEVEVVDRPNRKVRARK